MFVQIPTDMTAWSNRQEKRICFWPCWTALRKSLLLFLTSSLTLSFALLIWNYFFRQRPSLIRWYSTRASLSLSMALLPWCWVDGESHKKRETPFWVVRGSREEERISKRERYKKRNSKRHESCRGEASAWREGMLAQEAGTSPGAASQGQGWEPLSLQRLVGPAWEIISGAEGKEKLLKERQPQGVSYLKASRQDPLLAMGSRCPWFPWNSRKWLAEILSPCEVNG